jgi:hypothetical protein
VEALFVVLQRQMAIALVAVINLSQNPNDKKATALAYFLGRARSG